MALSTIPILKNSSFKLAEKVVPIMAIVAVGGVAYVGYQFLKKDKLPKLNTNPNLPKSTLSDVNVMLIAEKLYAAMEGVGTDEQAILAALSGLSENDFVSVYEAFGKRQYSMFWGNKGDPLTSGNHHLVAWLTNELGTAQIKELQKVIPNILTV